jgi:peptidylprolyl isomerase
MQNFISRLLVLTGLLGSIQAQTLSKETVLIETIYGNMKIKLYEETPLHKANFLKLVKERFFDSLLFHRVINNFMIQGGDPLSKKAKPGDSLGHGDVGYTVPAEFYRQLIHRKGVLCAAREGDEINPKQASSATQFYLVMGKKRTLEDLKKYEDRINKTRYLNCRREFLKTGEGQSLNAMHTRLLKENKSDSANVINVMMEEKIKAEYEKKGDYKFDGRQIEVYTGTGGTPHLDGTYTVFGEVIEGVEVIDRIAGVKTDTRDRPLEDIRMKISLVR